MELQVDPTRLTEAAPRYDQGAATVTEIKGTLNAGVATSSIGWEGPISRPAFDLVWQRLQAEHDGLVGSIGYFSKALLDFAGRIQGADHC